MNKPAKKPAKKSTKINVPSKIDWEKLARGLQEALRDEIAEGQGQIQRIENLEFEVRNLKHQAVGYQAVISYLENKLGNTSI